MSAVRRGRRRGRKGVFFRCSEGRSLKTIAARSDDRCCCGASRAAASRKMGLVLPFLFR